MRRRSGPLGQLRDTSASTSTSPLPRRAVSPTVETCTIATATPAAADGRWQYSMRLLPQSPPDSAMEAAGGAALLPPGYVAAVSGYRLKSGSCGGALIEDKDECDAAAVAARGGAAVVVDVDEAWPAARRGALYSTTL